MKNEKQKKINSLATEIILEKYAIILHYINRHNTMPDALNMDACVFVLWHTTSRTKVELFCVMKQVASTKNKCIHIQQIMHHVIYLIV